jgi:hypothetical protein
MVDWLIARAKRTPYYHLDGYMNRWWLVPYRANIGDGTGPVSPWRRPFAWLLQRFDIAVRIHEILSSDAGRYPHSHPWSYLPILLRGKYAEERFDSFGQMIDYRIYGPGSVLWRPAGSLHRLTLIDGPVTTFFITFKKRGSWGFHVNGKIVPHGEYKP